MEISDVKNLSFYMHHDCKTTFWPQEFSNSKPENMIYQIRLVMFYIFVVLIKSHKKTLSNNSPENICSVRVSVQSSSDFKILEYLVL